jgi:hypothetical protein
MKDDSWKIANSVAVSAGGFFAYRLCAALVARKLIEEDLAVEILTLTATDVRASTVGTDAEPLGDAVGNSYEQAAAWLLGRLGRLS